MIGVMIEIDEAAWDAAGVRWQRDGEAWRFLVPGRTEAPAARLKRGADGAAVTGPRGLPVLDLQTARSSSHRALAAFLKPAAEPAP